MEALENKVMKVGKDNQVKLSGIDFRVGNFVYSNYKEYVGFSDINRTIQTKVSKRTFVGQMLEMAVKGKNETFLHNYGGVIYYLLGVAPDAQFVEDAFHAAQACLERNPDLYGKMAVSDEEDAEIIQAERDMSEFGQDFVAIAEDSEE